MILYHCTNMLVDLYFMIYVGPANPNHNRNLQFLGLH